MARALKDGVAKGGCLVCGKPVDPVFRPFCSSRCKQLDLHRWLSESYRIPDAGRSAGDEGDDRPPSGQGSGAKNQSESED